MALNLVHSALKSVKLLSKLNCVRASKYQMTTAGRVIDAVTGQIC